MRPIIVYLVDDKEEARWANGNALEKLLASPDIKIVPIEPFPEYAQFNAFLGQPDLGGFFIDQKMKGGGVVNYNGIELAGYLRGIFPKLPIYILTGYPSEDFTGTRYRVEDIVDKEDIEDRESEKAKTLRARILRRFAVFQDVLSEREQKFHDLLVKSLREPLTSEEEKELGILEAERLVPAQEEDLQDVKVLEKAIEELRAKLGPDRLSL